mgnify:CR=1 FL=1
MTARKKVFPWPANEYVVLEEHNEVWLRGSWIRAMAKKQMVKEYGYEILLASREFIDKLRDDHSLREGTWHIQRQGEK